MIKPNLLSFLFFISYSIASGQSILENDRIAELYDLIPNMTPLYGTQVYVYDYKLKNKNTIKDSSLVTLFTIVDNQDLKSDAKYDTTEFLVTKYTIEEGSRAPQETFLLNASNQVLEHSIVNKESEILAKTFYKYENGLLISEESYTGYAYLESPRKISQISYKYENGLLAEKNKKYSLNGEHWIQTWVTKYDKSGRKTVLKETENGKINSYEYKFNSNNQIEKITVLSEEDKKSIKEITYYTNGSPKSILWYWIKRQKPIRMTKYFYK